MIADILMKNRPMINVAVSGAMGRLGRAILSGVEAAVACSIWKQWFEEQAE
jgi:dihydrodipicolinate reductase